MLVQSKQRNAQTRLWVRWTVVHQLKGQGQVETVLALVDGADGGEAFGDEAGWRPTENPPLFRCDDPLWIWKSVFARPPFWIEKCFGIRYTVFPSINSLYARRLM